MSNDLVRDGVPAFCLSWHQILGSISLSKDFQFCSPLR